MFYSPINTVHPHGRGEHLTHLRCGRLSRGSSPRARGTPHCHRMGTAQIRFIPAGAGNTASPDPFRYSLPVHPRGRGEHQEIVRQVKLAIGSSPRARGTLSSLCLTGPKARFIPAGAGNTREGLLSGQKSPVHPRGRGEHFIHFRYKHWNLGSSPRARGTRFRSCTRQHRRRFIPAGAGNTLAALGG